MIPIRDTQPSECFPVVTYGIMGMTLAVFLVQQTIIGMDNQAFFYHYGFLPAKYTVPDVSGLFSAKNHLFSPVTYMFLHGGTWHFLGNMWSLYIFGDNVEANLGPFRFLAFYIICGILSALFHFLLNPVSVVPTIGASGAIAGVMGAYFLLYPRARIVTLIPIVIIPWIVEIPAFIFLGFWFILQLLNAAGDGANAGIAWWAHIGGFVSGFVLILINRHLPSTGTRERVGHYTRRQHTPRLQTILAHPGETSADIYATIEISSLEALTGTRKLVSIPWGFHRPLYRVSIPPGVRRGTRLRLAGMGRPGPGQTKGDIFLTVEIKNEI